jgi:hypothetical protein
MNCVICQTLIALSNLATLSCHHIFCNSCWESWNNVKNHSATCPLCRKTPETDIVFLIYIRILHIPSYLTQLIEVCPDVGVIVNDTQIWYIFQLTTIEIKQKFRDVLDLSPLRLKRGTPHEYISNTCQSMNYLNLLQGSNIETTKYVIENDHNNFIYTISTYSDDPCAQISADVPEHKLLLKTFTMGRKSQTLFNLFIEFIVINDNRLLITGLPNLKLSITCTPSQLTENIQQYKTTCTKCKKVGVMKRCSKCNCTYYCSPECQKLDWKFGKHKELCKKLQ